MKNWIKKLFRQSAAAPEDGILSRKDVQLDAAGNAAIRPGIRVIGSSAFEQNQQLRCAVLPKSVTEIKYAAFRDCKKLEKLVLNEGLEIIADNTLSGCPKLKELVFPDSIRQVEAFAFYKTCFEKPVFNRSGTALHHYPNKLTDRVYAVPAGVKRLFAGAFFENTALEEVILPEGLERIDTRAFLDTKIRKITIPASVKIIEPRAFWSCKEPIEVHFACPESAFACGAFTGCKNVQLFKEGGVDYDEELRIRGRTRLGVVWKLKVPEGDFWKKEPFLTYAKGCSQRDPDAMMELASYFCNLGGDDFYKYAANFWRYRAYQLGHPEATQWKKLQDQLYPRQPIPAVLDENLSHGADGTVLRALGFLFFEPDRGYSLDGTDANGVVQADSWCGDDGPDEDGFGREEYYDWWLLDDTLNPIPGIRRWHSYSRREMRDREDQWQQLRSQAGQIVAAEKKKTQKTELKNDCGTFVVNAKGVLTDFHCSKENRIRENVWRCLDIPEGIRVIPAAVLCHCVVQERLQLPNSLEEISGFSWSRLPDVVLPEGLQTLGNFAFGHSYLRSLRIPKGLTSDYNRQFKGTSIGTLHISREFRADDTHLKIPGQNWKLYGYIHSILVNDVRIDKIVFE